MRDTMLGEGSVTSGTDICLGVRLRGAPSLTAVLAALLLVASTGVTAASAATSVSTAPVVAFMPAGEVGGGVLEPGATFPPTSGVCHAEVRT